MTIEVKQLIIKSTVTNDRSMEERRESPDIDLERLREMLLEECRELIYSTLNNMRER